MNNRPRVLVTATDTVLADRPSETGGAKCSTTATAGLSFAVMLLTTTFGSQVLAAMGASAQAPTTAVRAKGPHTVGSVIDTRGDDSIGELGIGSLAEETAPVSVPGVSDVTAISAGDRFTLALLANGTVMAWGDNQYGQLGNDSTLYSALPVPVKGLVGVTAVAAGGGQSLALLSDGEVMAWGDNEYRQLGNGTTTDSDVPELVPGLSDVTAVATGSLHSMALFSNGTVDTWGDNGSGQLGDGTLHDRTEPGPVGGLSGVTQISAGEQSSVALVRGGRVRSWGLESVGVSSTPHPGRHTDRGVADLLWLVRHACAATRRQGGRLE